MAVISFWVWEYYLYGNTCFILKNIAVPEEKGGLTRPTGTGQVIR